MIAAKGEVRDPGCFDSCGPHGEAYAHYAIAATVALTPFVALRIYQGEQSAPPAGRVLAATGVVVARSGRPAGEVGAQLARWFSWWLRHQRGAFTGLHRTVTPPGSWTTYVVPNRADIPGAG